VQTQVHLQLDTRHCPVDWRSAAYRSRQLPRFSGQVSWLPQKRGPAKPELLRCSLLDFANMKQPAAACLIKLSLNTNQPCSGAHSDTQLLSQTMAGEPEVALLSSLSLLAPRSKGVRQARCSAKTGARGTAESPPRSWAHRGGPLPTHPTAAAQVLPSAAGAGCGRSPDLQRAPHTALLVRHAVVVMVQLQETQRSWAGQPRDNSNRVAG